MVFAAVRRRRADFERSCSFQQRLECLLAKRITGKRRPPSSRYLEAVTAMAPDVPPSILRDQVNHPDLNSWRASHPVPSHSERLGGAARSVMNMEVGDARAGRPDSARPVEIPLVVVLMLEVPRQLAGIGIEPHHRIRVERFVGNAGRRYRSTLPLCVPPWLRRATRMWSGHS